MKKTILILIVLLAAFLRLYKLNSYPALNADEAAIGYNAYSLIKTGMDEHGNTWPIHFQSFNDYKPGLYFYVVLPFVKFIGLNSWAVRLPNAIIGVATVYLIYLLVRELGQRQSTALLSALFLAISPWHIHFSRGGWEVNTATFFILSGVYLFLRYIRTKKFINFALSVLVLVLSLYTYHAARIVGPLLVFGLIIFYFKELFRNIKHVIIAVFIGILLILPLVKDLTSGQVLSRAAGVGLFADLGPINRINEERGEHGTVNGVFAKVIHNKVTNYSLAFLDNWAAHYHGLFLFLSGDDIQRNKVPETGQMYMLDVVWLIIGLLVIARNSKNKNMKFIVWWLIVAPVAAALTFQAPHALRAENMVIPLVVISSIGFSFAMDLLRSKKLIVGIYLFGILIAWQFARYEHMYWVHMAKEYPFSSQYGLPELVNYLKDNGSKYKDIVITDRYDQPYILTLFYLKYPPEKFQADHRLTDRDGYGFSTVRKFDKYHFTSIDFDTMKVIYPGSLIIGTPSEIPKEANIVKKIYGSNGYEYFDVVAN